MELVFWLFWSVVQVVILGMAISTGLFFGAWLLFRDTMLWHEMRELMTTKPVSRARVQDRLVEKQPPPKAPNPIPRDRAGHRED